MKNVLLLVLTITLILGACKETPKDQKSTDNQGTKAETAKQMSYILSGQTPHDITSFTEGLFLRMGNYLRYWFTQELSQTRSIAGPVDIKTENRCKSRTG